ncbi:MAG: DNA primase [Acholeplasmatales bacterium]|nr:DNA primase [Acholeplasmatales bacterium]
MATQEEIKEVLDKTDVVSVVERYLPLKKSGKNYMGLCPFHSEKTPSFVVSPDKKLAKCFGCGGGGTIIDFVMQIENVDFNQALTKLADEAGVKLSNVKRTEISPVIKRYYDIMNSSLDFYEKYLESTDDGKKALEYLKNRGMDDELIKDFKIGLAPDIGNTLYRVLKEYQYFELDMEDLGLVASNEKGYHDVFSRRIMFPIFNETGNVVAYSGRIFDPKDKDNPKYINSPETPIFKKNEILFNLNLAKGVIRKNNRVVLHEGQMDVIASYKSGIKEAVCTLGTALTTNHVQTLKKYTNNVVIAYDGDKAGIKASKKAISLFLQAGFNVRLILFPDGMDPDEYVKKYGKDGYLKFLNDNLMDAYEYEFNVAFIGKDLKDSIVVEAVKDELFQMMNNLPSNTLKEEYLTKLAEKLNVGGLALSNDFDFYVRTHTSRKHKVEPSFVSEDEPKVEPKEIEEKKWNSPCELRLFMYAKSSKERALRIDNLIQDEIMNAFSSYSINLWIKLINDYYAVNDKFSESKFINILNVEELNFYMEILETVRKDKTPYNEVDENKCIEHIKIVALEKEIEKLNKMMEKATQEKKYTYVNRVFELKKKLVALKKQNKRKERN